MTLGEKIKNARKKLQKTQAEIAGNKITRNMLSRIESGNATPSLETIFYLAKRLSVPVSYLMSQDDDLLFYEKKEKISDIYNAYSHSDYNYCIETINSFSGLDNELTYILAACYLKLAQKSVNSGSLHSALKYIRLCQENCNSTIFETSHLEMILPLYEAIATNIQAPLLELDSEAYTKKLSTSAEYETFKYLIQDNEYPYKNECLRDHIKAKKLIKDRRYNEAVELLLKTAENGRANYNALLMFGVYSDLELCYKQLYDFENAYRYSSKRISMLEGFKS